ncbi:MAG: hypothetical protein K0R29_2002 [Pseudobdellovibrio sp.]|nr:hypothetical protein [Pseudobdellovibrio sp.]
MAGLEKFRIEVKYVRRARRATLRVKPRHLIKLSLPYGVKRAQIEEWIHSKTNWILEKHEMLESQTKNPAVQFIEGAQVPFGGGPLLLVRAQKVKWVELHGSDLLVPEKYFKSEESVRRAVFKWYQEQALAAALNRVEYYCQQLGVKAKSVRLKNYRSRWGACSSKGELIFNWQIILLKNEMFEYVVAHEVCHLIEMNHSERFYSLLAKLGFNKSEMHRQFKHLKNLI